MLHRLLMKLTDQLDTTLKKDRTYKQFQIF